MCPDPVRCTTAMYVVPQMALHYMRLPALAALLTETCQLWINDKLPLLRAGKDYDLLASKAGQQASISIEIAQSGSAPPAVREGPSSGIRDGTARTVLLAPVPSVRVQWTKELVAQLVRKAVPLHPPVQHTTGEGSKRSIARTASKLSFILPDVSDWDELKDELVAAGPFKTDRIWERTVVKRGKRDEHTEYSSCLTCCRSRESAPIVAPTTPGGEQSDSSPDQRRSNKSARCVCRTRIAAKVRSDRRGVQVTITDRLAHCTAPTDRKERAMVSKFVHQLASWGVPPTQVHTLIAHLSQDMEALSPQDRAFYLEWLPSGKYCQVLRSASVRQHR